LHTADYIEKYETIVAQLKALDPSKLPSKESILAAGEILQGQINALTIQFEAGNSPNKVAAKK